MRGLRSTIALLVVLVGLGAYIYFVTWKTAGRRRRRSAGEGVRRRSKPTRSTKLKVKSAAGDVTTLKKDGGAWQIVAPITAPRPTSPKSSGITNALGAARDRRASSTRTRPTSRTTASTRRASRSTSRRPTTRTTGKLLVGDKTPTGGDLYAKRNDEKRVFLIPAFQETSLNKSTFDLRDKTVMKFERDKVDGVDVTAGGKTLAVRQGRHRLEDRRSRCGAGRLSVGRRAGRPRRDGADEVDRHRARDAGRPEEVRPRQAGGDRQPAPRQRPRHAAGRRQGGRQRPSTRATRRSRSSSPSRARCSTT